MGDAWIIDAVRTPRGKGKKGTPERPGGSLVETHPQELMATCLRALSDRNPIDA
ncbi:MAG: acetyl-CoA C-acyltransferase, partial [Chromatiales bacterium]|nr:acetyl-CoA C-acyltransferase [Chromatiales bacterium]